MRIWINNIGGVPAVNFQPESLEEEELLDKVLGFDFGKDPVLLGTDSHKKVKSLTKAVGYISGHERQRWIQIDLNKLQPTK
jgi:hypothetical protein